MRKSGEVSASPMGQWHGPSSHTEVLFQKANDIFSLTLPIFVLTLSSYVNIWTECFFETSRIKDRCGYWMWIVREGRKCFNTCNSVNLCLLVSLSGQIILSNQLGSTQSLVGLPIERSELALNCIPFCTLPFIQIVLTNVSSFYWLILSCIWQMFT